MPQIQVDDLMDELVAAEDLSAKAFHFVQLSVSGVNAAATAGQKGVIGVLHNSPASAGRCLIVGGGMTPVIAGVAVAKGDAVMSDAAGKAITCAASSANHIYGYAIEAASGAGVKFRIAFGYHGPVVNNS